MKAIQRLIFLLVALTRLFGQGLTEDQIRQKLLAQPPQTIVTLAEKLAKHGNHPSISVVFTPADLDGDGSFNFFVALYSVDGAPDNGGVLRVFKRQGENVVVAGDQVGRRYVGGYGTQLDLIDVNSDGVPEVEVTSVTADGQQELFSLFMWTGSSLHDMLGNRVETGNFVDIDNDGVLEIVDTRSDGKGYDIYKLSGSDYQFLKTVKDDPRGLVGTNGKINYVRAFCRVLEPPHFSLSEIQEALAGKPAEREHEGRENVHLTFGGLQRVNAGPVTVDQVDTSTVVVSPHLIPIRASVHPAHGEDRGRDADRDEDKDSNEICEKDHGKISVELARTDFLRGLQKLQPRGPLAVGDQIEIRLTAKLKDGSPVSAIFKAKIVGEHNRDDGEKEKDHKDKPGS